MVTINTTSSEIASETIEDISNSSSIPWFLHSRFYLNLPKVIRLNECPFFIKLYKAIFF